MTQCQRSRREDRGRPDESLHRAGITLMRMPTTAAGDAAPASGQPDPQAGSRGCGSRRGRSRRWPASTGCSPCCSRPAWCCASSTQIAYRPALLYIDSTKYLLNAYPGDDPPGYQLALKPVLALGNLDLIAVHPAPARPGHGHRHIRAVAAPRRAALAGGPGHRPGPARRLPAADRAERHARRHVRGADRGRRGRPAVAGHPVALAGRGRRAWPWAPRPPPARSARSSSCPPWATC